MKHLLVTNDFPPKIGGIQSYLWELWRRLPAESAAVLATPYAGADEFDAATELRIERIDERVMLPTAGLRDRILRTADEVGAELVLLDPALPLGHLGPGLGRPYGVILHGAEVTVPGRVPGPRAALARVLAGADLVVAAGGYPAAEGERAVGGSLPIVQIPPGVDTERFAPLVDVDRAAARKAFGVGLDVPLVVSVSRLVPRKGMDVLVEAAARLAPAHPDLTVLIGGKGRDEGRLRRLIERTAAPVRMLGRVPDEHLPALYGTADVFAMACRSRWMGLEQEGFGIVFVEAAATGVAQIAGDSGGSAEAVVHGETGLVLREPSSVDEMVIALDHLLTDRSRREAMGRRSRERAVELFSYDVLARHLGEALGVS